MRPAVREPRGGGGGIGAKKQTESEKRKVDETNVRNAKK